jgi:transposase
MALLRKKLKRAEVGPFFKELSPCRIGLEACPGGHHWARLLRNMGHDVSLLPAQYVRPYMKTNKNDAADAEAICETMTRPSMRFVPIKEDHQQESLVLHRAREMLMRQRTQLINGIRGHLTEFGIIAPARAHRVRLLIDVIRDEDDTRLPPAARRALNDMVGQFEDVAAKPASIETELVALARQDETCRRLMTIPGVGVIIATAMVASTRDPNDYKSSRHFSA